MRLVRCLALAGVAALLLLASGCLTPTATPSPGTPTASPSPTATLLPPTLPPPTLTPTLTRIPSRAPPRLTPTPRGPFPSVLAELDLGVELRDLIVDHGRMSLYVNDSASRLYELDISALSEGKLSLRRSVLAGAGGMALDSSGGLLLVAGAGQDGSQVSVVELDSLSVGLVITGGDQIALDARRGRAFVSTHPATFPPAEGETQVWDLALGERVGVIPEGGALAYNAERDEVYVCGYGCRAYDAETLARRASLTPDIDEQPCPGCPGKLAVVDVTVHPDLEVVALHMTITSAGKGPGLLPGPRFLDSRTLAPLTHTLTYLPTCAGKSVLLPPLGGRVYQNLVYSRYISRANVVARDAATGETLDWRDGLTLELITQEGRLGFVRRGDEWMALDLRSWTPLGHGRRYCVHSYDGESGLFYALEGSRLVVLLPDGVEPGADPGPHRAALGGGVREIRVSPCYEGDETLFVVGEEHGLYRSANGGEDWDRLAGGLPHVWYPADASLGVALSPDYGRDHILYAGGWDGGGRGLGVWRSADGGDSWQPLWRGLTHLNVERIVLSHEFATDGVVLAYCRYTDLAGGDAGQSVFHSQDRGEHWQLVAEVSNAEADRRTLPQPKDLIPWPTPVAALRVSQGLRVLEAGREGDDWVPLLELPRGEYLVAYEPLARSDGRKTLYALASRGLYRSTDGGDTWGVAGGPLFEKREVEQGFTALALGRDSEGREVLFVGDRAGGVHRVHPDALGWEPYP